ncbi:hypothetical protein B9G39_29025 [Zooshikella ganghwensis]|uniref:Uncharacterized protein n=1 Tax=Zooshikella ganghwensis TaxID=202772 RepID=A0A4P9VG16_9GAMM|nr:hypothetical protein B9G39_29025 [Zooshikella ganghwensis]
MCHLLAPGSLTLILSDPKKLLLNTIALKYLPARRAMTPTENAKINKKLTTKSPPKRSGFNGGLLIVKKNNPQRRNQIMREDNTNFLPHGMIIGITIRKTKIDNKPGNSSIVSSHLLLTHYAAMCGF